MKGGYVKVAHASLLDLVGGGVGPAVPDAEEGEQPHAVVRPRLRLPTCPVPSALPLSRRMGSRVWRDGVLQSKPMSNPATVISGR